MVPSEELFSHKASGEVLPKKKKEAPNGKLPADED